MESGAQVPCRANLGCGAGMQTIHEDKPGLHPIERSSATHAEPGHGGRPLAGLALFAVFGLTLDGFGSALAWLDLAAFERYCRVVDGSWLGAGLQLAFSQGPAVVLLARHAAAVRSDTREPPGRRRAVVVLHGAALAHVAAYVLLLRLPWLTEQAAAHNRLDLWSARLSATSWGVPLLAFLLSLGWCTLFTAVAVATLHALRESGLLRNPTVAVRVRTAIWGLSSVGCVLALLTLITFATGGWA